MEENKYLNKSIEEIKEDIRKRMQTKKMVYISINNGRLKVNNAFSEITGVYDHFVSFKSYVNNYNQSYTINLVEFMTGKAVMKDEK